MFTASKSRPAFALLLVCCLPVPAFSDEYQYLPDNARVIGSIDVTAAAKTKTFQEFRKQYSKERDEEMGKYVSMIARATIGMGMPAVAKGEEATTEQIKIETAIKAITIDEIKTLKTLYLSYQRSAKNVAFKEIKYGAVTIYQET